MHTNSYSTVEDLSLEEQASLGSGAGFWNTVAVGATKSFILTDGPHGVRKQIASDDHLGIAPSMPATCFPPAAALAQSWDVDLLESVGIALGQEAKERNVGVLLGPGVNIKRDPRCGRNFEYFSEDPMLSGALGAAWVTGLQSEGVGASVKHFAANNAETDRMRASSDVDPRTLREIYLRSFQRVVEEAKPWTVMCSYNRVNGVYASEDRWLLTSVLRDEWDFDGVVVSDWGAVKDRVAAVRAGLDLEMPGGTETDALVVRAVENGTLESSVVAVAANRVALLSARVERGRRVTTQVDPEDHHHLARDAAAKSVVLLKNDQQLLPLAPAGRIAVVGEFAKYPRFQGGGSSRINPTKVDIPLEEIRALAGDATVTYARGFTTDGTGDDGALRDDAVLTAADSDVTILFLGLGDGQESEGFDRDTIDLPADQLALVAAIVAVQSRVVVVLSHGGVVILADIANAVPAILDGSLLGQAGGGAIADILFGEVNPSARLSETVPVRLQDAPAYLNFPGENSHIIYGEGLHVGYRWYDAREIPVTYPFGHGLSYTTFDYSDLELSSRAEGVEATVRITNTGDVAGREVVQFYSAMPGSAKVRPPRELKGFAVVDLDPGEDSVVTVTLRSKDLQYWETRIDGWRVEAGDYEVSAGSSSRDLRQSATVTVASSGPTVPLTEDSTMGEIMSNPAAAAIVMGALQGSSEGSETAATELGLDVARMMESYPINRLGFFAGEAGRPALMKLLQIVNG